MKNNKIEVVERSSGFWLVDDSGPIDKNAGPHATYAKAVKARDSKNLCSKMRDKKEPYEIWQSFDGTWTWNVLRKYQSPAGENKNEFARWFCNVVTPMCPRGELGDVYVREIKSLARQIG